jgi:4-amino-4-deoxy-L-arabinose transferase-like glycosyltransferase
VRRLAGPHAAICAAAVLVLAPATMALDRGNIPDTLLVLLLTLAADSVVASLITGRSRSLLMAGVWVGLAFQAKMIEAWLALPALALAYFVAATGKAWTRLLRIAAMLVVVAAVSLSWMLFVSLTPASQRPYVDGSTHNSVFEQVFDYNGFGRVGELSPNAQMGRNLGISFLSAPGPSPSWNRLFSGSYGRDTGWLLPAALVVVAAGLFARRRRPRSDLFRTALILWGTWLVALGVVFSISTTINAYYLAALSPPIAALVGLGMKLAWDHRRSVPWRLGTAAVVMLTAVYGYWLLPASGTGCPSWLGPTVVVLGVAATAAVVTTLLSQRMALVMGAAGAAAVAGLLIPSVATTSVVTNTLGPFDTPFQPAALTTFNKAFFGAPLDVGSVLPRIEKVTYGAPDLMATQTSVLAAPFIFTTGREVLPIGGYTGNLPEPSVQDLESMVASRRFHLVLTGPQRTDPRVDWIAHHCLSVPSPPNAPGVTLALRIYFCTGHG